MSSIGMEQLVLYTKSLKSKHTQKTYLTLLTKFQKSQNIDNLEDLLTKDPKVIQEIVAGYLIKLDEEQHLSYASRSLSYLAIKHYFDVAQVVINWKWVSSFLGENNKTVEDRPYTLDEIKQLLTKCDERKRVIVLTLASTGMRLGGIAGLKIRNLTKMDDLYMFTVYEATKAKYVTFCTPETAQAIDSYLEYRKRCGERLMPESPLIRESFDKNDPFQISKPLPTNEKAIQNIIFNLLYDSGLRSKAVGEDSKFKRKEVMAVHGLRKWFVTELTRAIRNPVAVELLVGHDIGLKGVYYKPSAEDMLAEYRGGINALTIDEANRLKEENSQLKGKVDDIQLVKAQLEEMKAKQEGTNELLNALASGLEKKGAGKEEIIDILAAGLNATWRRELTEEEMKIVEEYKAKKRERERIEK